MAYQSETQPKSLKQTYTVNEIADILSISKRSAYYLCDQTTEFKVIHIGKRGIRIHKKSFDDWFCSNY